MLKSLAAGVKVAEREFDLIFPKEARKASRTHWTPLAAALRAVELLAHRPGARVLGARSAKVAPVLRKERARIFDSRARCAKVEPGFAATTRSSS